MKLGERFAMVKAMEFIARQINDEEVFDTWLSLGVADGDISYGYISLSAKDLEELGYYIGDEQFSDLMGTFLKVMNGALRSGGLACDGVVSK